MNNLSLIFSKIVINNFLSIREAEVSLNDQGFVTVKGKNRLSNGSNGSGKSSIFDAIFWTLTGETLRGTSEVVNENHKNEGCLCRLTIFNKNDEYEIVRTKSHSSLGNSCTVSVNGEVISDQIRKSQELISNLIPVVSSPDIFGSIVLLGQGLPYKFSSFSPSKRKDLLETMSGSSSDLDSLKYKLDIIESTTKSSQSNLLSEVSRIKGSLDGIKESVSTLESQIKDTESEDNDSLASYEQEISRLQGELLKVEGRKEIVSSNISEAESEKTSKQTLLDALRSSLYPIKLKIEGTATGNCPTCGRPFEVDEETLKSIEVLKVKRNSFDNRINSVSREISDIEESLRNLRSSQLDDINTESSIRHSISEISSKISLKKELSSKIDSMRSKVKELRDKITELNIKRNEYEETLKVCEEKLECIAYLKRQISREFKGYVLNEVVDFLSTRSEYYGKELFTSGEKISVSLSGSKINIFVGNKPYENLSGGERQRVDLSVQFSLRDMLMTVTGFSCNMLVLDEVFDNLDFQGSELLVNLIASHFSDVDTVFVITHRSEICIPYDNEIVVVKDSSGDSSIV